MTYVRVKGFQVFKDRHGKARCYHRATRTAVDLAKFPMGSAEFLAECLRITALMDKAAIARAGTLGKLIEKYRAHAAFTDLAPRTRDDYQKVLDYLKPIADTPLNRFNPPLVVKIRDKAGEAKGRRFGTYVKTVLSVVFGWGVERGELPVNPAFKIKAIRRPKDAPEANRPWRDHERDAVLAALPPRLVPPIALMMFTGMDPGDALKLPRSAIRDGMIDSRRGKTGVPMWIPMASTLRDLLVAAPAHDAVTVCANGMGRPWTDAGFRTEWRKVRMKLEKAEAVEPGLTLKGLRHTVATILAESGLDDRAVADMLSQKTLAMAQHYSRRADKTRKVAGIVESFEAEVNRRATKVVKPA